MRGWCWIVLMTAAVFSARADTGVDVQFVAKDSVEIQGTFFPPAGASAPALILLPMLGRSRQSWSAFADSACRHGFAVLTLDPRNPRVLAGRGEAEAEPVKTDSVLRKDIAAAVAWLRGPEGRITGKIGLVGTGFGANLALNYAANDLQIGSLVLISPGEDYRGIKALPDLQAYGARPALVVSAEDDNYSAITTKALAQVAQKTIRFELRPDGGHGMYLLEDTPGLSTLVLDYLNDTLRK